jgi:hypothetical protein
LLDAPCVDAVCDVVRDVSDAFMFDDDAPVALLGCELCVAPVAFSAIFGVDVLVPELAAFVPSFMPALGVALPLT